VGATVNGKADAMSDIKIGEDAPIFEVMSTMRAMRRLRPDPVPEELLARLVEAATWAPSASNAQCYQFVVVTDRERMERLAELWTTIADFYLTGMARAVPPGSTEERHERLRGALRFQRDHFAQTPAVIVACYDFGPYRRRLRAQARHLFTAFAQLGPRRAVTAIRHMPRFTATAEAASMYPSVQNILLAARALGLGATLTTWHLVLESEFKAVLGIPRSVHTFAVIPVGWPRGRFGPVARHAPADVLHRDGW